MSGWIPSAMNRGMFQRRLFAVGGVFVLVVAALATRLWGLAVVDGDRHLEVAESRADRGRLLPTWRGTIRDRRGRVIAEDVPSYDLALRYEFITGSWIGHQARTTAMAKAGRAAWARMTPGRRTLLVEEHGEEMTLRREEIMNQVAALGGMSRAQLDERCEEIVAGVERVADAVRARQLQARVALDGPEAASSFSPEPVREQTQSHVIAPSVSDSVAFAARRLADAFPRSVEVIDAATRSYPWSKVEIDIARGSLPVPLRSSAPETVVVTGVADHLIGSVRTEVQLEDIARRPLQFRDADGALVIDLGGYQPGRDSIGTRGMELAAEDTLRGTRGELLRNVAMNEEVRIEPIPGRDINLSIDIALQARIEATLHSEVGLTEVQPWHLGWVGGLPKPGPLPIGTQLAAAAVVIEVASGEILAMASTPSVESAADMSDADRARLQPYVDRAAAAAFAPGSVIKPLVYAAAVAEGVFRVDEAVTCTGHYFSDRKDVARCWIYRPEYRLATHTEKVGGPLGVEQGIARSCNIFFYTLADRLGAERLTSWLRSFGLGSVPDCGLLVERPIETGIRRTGEASGTVPSESMLDRLRRDNDHFTPVILGIGQGPITWSPLQAAHAYATLARAGEVRGPSIYHGPRPDGRGRDLARLNIPREAVLRALEGMRRSIEERYGTGHHMTMQNGAQEPIFDFPAVEVWAKTGTAQAPGIRVDVDEDGNSDRPITGADHAWFVGLAGDRANHTPRYAIAVLIENGGPGGRAAGPVAAAVVQSLIDEGYLGGAGDQTQ